MTAGSANHRHPMTVVFLAPEYPPIRRTGSIRSEQIVRLLSNRGLRVIVETLQPANQGTVADLWTASNVRVVRRPVPKIRFISDWGILYFLGYTGKLYDTTRFHEADAIVTTVPPFMSGISALIVATIRRVPLIFDFRDLWSGDPDPASSVKLRLYKRIGNLFESLILWKARTVFFVSRRMRQDFAKGHPIVLNLRRGRSRLRVARNGIDLRAFLVGADSTMLPKRLRRSLYLAHLGNADGNMNISELCQLLNSEEVRRFLRGRGIKIALIGGKNELIVGELDPGFEDFVEDMNWVPYETAIAIAKNAAALILLGANNDQRLHRKVFDYVCAERPILFWGAERGPTVDILRASARPILHAKRSRPDEVITFLSRSISDADMGDKRKEPEELSTSMALEDFSFERTLLPMVHELRRIAPGSMFRTEQSE